MQILFRVLKQSPSDEIERNRNKSLASSRLIVFKRQYLDSGIERISSGFINSSKHFFCSSELKYFKLLLFIFLYISVNTP